LLVVAVRLADLFARFAVAVPRVAAGLRARAFVVASALTGSAGSDAGKVSRTIVAAVSA
jgi:hypothetical protein